MLPFGRLGRPHGTRGEVVLHPFNPGGVDLAALAPLAVSVGGRPMRLTGARPISEGFLVRFEGTATRDQAASLTHAELSLPREALPALDDGEFYVEDLVGCEVYDLEGRRRGVVRAILWNGAHDVLTIEDGAGGELLLPAVADFLREVDLPARRVVVDTHE